MQKTNIIPILIEFKERNIKQIIVQLIITLNSEQKSSGS